MILSNLIEIDKKKKKEKKKKGFDHKFMKSFNST